MQKVSIWLLIASMLVPALCFYPDMYRAGSHFQISDEQVTSQERDAITKVCPIHLSQSTG